MAPAASEMGISTPSVDRDEDKVAALPTVSKVVRPCLLQVEMSGVETDSPPAGSSGWRFDRHGFDRRCVGQT